MLSRQRTILDLLPWNLNSHSYAPINDFWAYPDDQKSERYYEGRWMHSSTGGKCVTCDRRSSIAIRCIRAFVSGPESFDVCKKCLDILKEAYREVILAFPEVTKISQIIVITGQVAALRLFAESYPTIRPLPHLSILHNDPMACSWCRKYCQVHSACEREMIWVMSADDILVVKLLLVNEFPFYRDILGLIRHYLICSHVGQADTFLISQYDEIPYMVDDDDCASVDIVIPTEYRQTHDVIMHWIAREGLYAIPKKDETGYYICICDDFACYHGGFPIGEVTIFPRSNPHRTGCYIEIGSREQFQKTPKPPLREYLMRDDLHAITIDFDTDDYKCIVCGSVYGETPDSHHPDSGKCATCSRFRFMLKLFYPVPCTWILTARSHGLPVAVVSCVARLIDQLILADMTGLMNKITLV
jgi:hypothetical protein